MLSTPASSGCSRRVDFFVIGVQKGGTTALDNFLRMHSCVQMATAKEAHFFDDENVEDWSRPPYRRFHKLFDWSTDNVIRGECTPIYIVWPGSMARLKNYNPSAKLIVGLRHPSFRALSQWRMNRLRGQEQRGFAESIADQDRAERSTTPGAAFRVYSYIERGMYDEQIERLFALFDRHQVHFFRTDHLWNDPATVLAAIEKFLGVEAQLHRVAKGTYIVPVDTRNIDYSPTVPPLELTDLFHRSIEHTSNLTGLDLSDWLMPQYREPMRRAHREVARGQP